MSRIPRYFRIGFDFMVRGLTIVGLARKYGMTRNQIEKVLRRWPETKRGLR